MLLCNNILFQSGQFLRWNFKGKLRKRSPGTTEQNSRPSATASGWSKVTLEGWNQNKKIDIKLVDRIHFFVFVCAISFLDRKRPVWSDLATCLCHRACGRQSSDTLCGWAPSWREASQNTTPEGPTHPRWKTLCVCVCMRKRERVRKMEALKH